MSGRIHAERSTTSREEEEVRDTQTTAKKAGESAVAAAAAAANEIDEIDRVIEEDAIQAEDFDKLMAGIDDLLKEVNAEQLVAEFVQKGGQ